MKRRLLSTARLSFPLVAAFAALLAVPSARAQLTWDANGVTAAQTDGAGAWLTANQWWNGAANVNWTSGSSAIFGNGGAGGAVTLASPTTVDSITFNAFTGTYTLGTAGQTITLNNGITKNATATGAAIISSPVTLGAAQSWLNNSAGLLTVGTGAVNNGGFLLTVGGTGNTTVSGAIGGTGGIAKQDAGTLTLTGGNTFSGGIVINGGALTVSNDTNLGAAANGITFNGAATFNPATNSYARAITINSGAIVTFGNVNPTFTGNVTGTGGVATSSGNGSQITFSGAGNTFEGPVLIAGTGVTGQAYRASFGSLADSATANGKIIFSASAVTHANGSVFEYTGASNLTLNNRQFEIASTGTLTPTNGHQIRNYGAGAATLTIITNLSVTSTTAQTLSLGGTSSGLSTFAGNITNGSSTAVTVTKVGAGNTWELSGSNGYTGGTTITSGKLIFSGANSLPATGTIAVGAAGHLSLADGTARNSTTPALTLASLANLSFDWTGTGTGDQLTSTAAVATAAGNVFAINMKISGAPGAGGVTLLTGGAASTLNNAGYYLANATNYTATLAKTATTVSIDNYAAAAPLTTLYWQGNQLAATATANLDNAWALSDGTKTNWSSTNTGYTATALTPGSTANVIFADTQVGKAQQATTLGAEVTVNSVTIDDSTAVTIAGTGNSSLTLLGTSPTAGTVASPGSAISVTANAANPTISARVNLGSNQTWNVASGKTLTVSGIVDGPFSLTKADTGTLILTGGATGNTYTGGTTINANSGTLQANIIFNGNQPLAKGMGPGAVSVGTGSTALINNTNTSGSTVIIDNTFTGAGLLKLQFATGATGRNTTMPNVTGVAGTIQLSALGATADKWNVQNLGTVAAPLIVDSGTTLFASSGTTSFTGGITLNGTGNSEGRGTIRMGGAGTTLGGNITLAASSTISMENVTSVLSGNISSGNAALQTLTLGGTGSTGGILSGVIGGGTGPLAVTTAVGGIYTFSTANSYTDVTTIGAGAIVAGANNALGTVAGNTLVAAGASIAFQGGVNYATAETVLGSGAGLNATLGAPIAVGSRGFVQGVGTGNSTFAGAVQINATGLSRIGTQTGAQLTLSGPVTMATGTTGVTVLFRVGDADGDFVALSNGGNNWDGQSQIFTGNAGITGFSGVRLGVNNGLPAAIPLASFIGAGAGTAMDLAGFHQEVNGLIHGSNGALTLRNSVAATTSVLTLNTTADRDFGTGGVIQDGAGTVQLVKTGAFQQILRGANTYTGGTLIKNGSLALLSGNDRLATTGSVTLGDTGTTGKLVLGDATSASNQTLAGLVTAGSGGSVVGANATTDAVITLSIASGTNAFDGTLGGALANENKLALGKSGGGTLTLSGISTYTGATTVSAGSLLVNGELGNTAVTVNDNATLGGSGLLNGTVIFAANSFLEVNLADPLQINGAITFGSGFGIDNLTGINWDSVPLGALTLLNSTQDFSVAGLDNWGAANAASVGSLGRTAYFQNGSLGAVVVPETGAVSLLGLATLFTLRRRRNRSLADIG